jgi:hypothetical protein
LTARRRNCSLWIELKRAVTRSIRAIRAIVGHFPSQGNPSTTSDLLLRALGYGVAPQHGLTSL